MNMHKDAGYLLCVYRKSHASVINELELKRTQLLWETNKLSDAEAKLYRSQQEEAQLRKEQSKLCMRFQEKRESLEHGINNSQS